MPYQRVQYAVNRLYFPCLIRGKGKKLIVFLHGFPDTPDSLVPLMDKFSSEEYTLLAPFMRGYSAENIPMRSLRHPLATVQVCELVDDVLGIISAAGFTSATIVGHDWGAITAYAIAAHSPKIIENIVCLSVPPIPTFLRNLIRFPRQFAYSWYILFFQLRFKIPERVVLSDDADMIETLWANWSPGYIAPHKNIQAAKSILSQSDNLRVALGYYRGLLQPSFEELKLWNQSRKLLFSLIRIRSLVITGENDHCVTPDMFTGLESRFQAEAKFRVIPSAGHFLPLEATDLVYKEIQAFGLK